MNLKSSRNFMIIALICFRKSLRNRFRQEGSPLSGIRAFLFIHFNFLLSIHFPIFLMLSQVCSREMLTFFIFKDEKMACRINFQNHRRFSEKNAPLKAWRSWVFPCVCHDICCHKEAFQKPIIPCHDYLSFSFQSYFPSMLESTFSLPYTS